MAIVADGHRFNQKCLNNLSCNANNYLSKSEMFLLYDYVHVVKCIRNNWLTEKCKQKYEFKGTVQTAKKNLPQLLHDAEEDEIVKLSKLDHVAVFLKPIERQKESTCLKFL